MGTVLVTGGLGFIGSHTVVQLQQAGYEVVIFDNACNSSPQVLERIKQITGTMPVYIQGDVRDGETMRKIFAGYTFTQVIHFAALKSVGESCTDPFSYRDTNIIGTMRLLQIMDEYDVRQLVFSSSATVYDATHGTAPFDETMRTGHTTNPYGTTKHVVEQLLEDMVNRKEMTITSLRYFNPIGAHPSGLIGEDPRDTPTNLLPLLLEVAEGSRARISVFGDNYATDDGSCLRDYIHVMDLADAHVAVLGDQKPDGGYAVYNVGGGTGTSVLEMIALVEEVTQQTVPLDRVERRAGDVGVSIADVSKIATDLGWSVQWTIQQAIAHAWKYRQGFYKK